MGWADCGTDQRGRKIGYAVEARCDDPDCCARIDRGLDYCCGGRHGGTEHGCGGYFCGSHLYFVNSDAAGQLCAACTTEYRKTHPDCEHCGGWGYEGQPGDDLKCPECRGRGYHEHPATTDAQEGRAGMPYIDSPAGTAEPRHTDAQEGTA